MLMDLAEILYRCVFIQKTMLHAYYKSIYHPSVCPNVYVGLRLCTNFLSFGNVAVKKIFNKRNFISPPEYTFTYGFYYHKGMLV